MANKPNNPSLWSRAKSLAKKKFDVYPCVPMDSQALTKDGWKYYHELNVGDEILAHNIEKNINEWTPIIGLQKFADAPIIRLFKKQTNFDIKCTPNHKWVLDESNSKYPGNLVEAKDINRRMKIRTSAVLGEDNKPLELVTFFKKDNWVKNILKMAISQVQSFFASGIVYDGHDKGLSNNSKKQTYGFSQKDIDHGLAMEIAATLLGYRVCSVIKKHNQTMRSWTFIRRTFESTQNLHKEDAGTADVWCPTTKYGTWVMKQNGYVTITGNSAYANGWAAKWYKSKGGTWRSAKYGAKISMKNGGKFPDLTGDGKVTRADVLKGRGVFKSGGRLQKAYMAKGGNIRKTTKGPNANFRPTKSGAGMTEKGVRAYRRANPGSKLQTAVTGKVKPGSKDAKRRKSYCARSLGQLKKASQKTQNDPNSRIRQARRRWKC